MSSLVDEVLGGMNLADGATGARGEGEAEENEMLLRENNPCYEAEARMLEFSSMDAKVGDGRRIHEEKGYLDGVVGARHGFGSGVVLAALVVCLLLEENRGGIDGVRGGCADRKSTRLNSSHPV